MGPITHGRGGLLMARAQLIDCATPGCERWAAKSGLCERCYARARYWANHDKVLRQKAARRERRRQARLAEEQS